MKSNKSQTLLYLYDLFFEGEKVVLEYFCSECSITKQTFHRYISELRAFYANHYIPAEIIYSREGNYYYLKK